LAAPSSRATTGATRTRASTVPLRTSKPIAKSSLLSVRAATAHVH
jgi:hypothetical protein